MRAGAARWNGVGSATESRDCVPVRGRRPAGRLGAARVAACELGRLAPLPRLCRPLELVHARRRSALGGCAGHSRRGDLCHCPNHRFPAARGGNWVRSASYDFRDFDGADPRNEGAARLFRVYCCVGIVLARGNGGRSQARRSEREDIMKQRLDTFDSGTRWPSVTTQGDGR